MKAFNSDHQGDEEFKDKAKTKCKDILYWCYLVSVNSDNIKAIPSTLCSIPTVIQALKATTTKDLHQGITRTEIDHHPHAREEITQTITRPLEMPASSAASNQDFLRKLTQIQSQTNDKTSKSFKKLPLKYQNMIKVASSIGEVTALDITDNANEFFKSSSVLNAEILLNTIMETEKIECCIPTSMATSLLHGSFLWTNSITPSGLSCSVINSEDLF